MRSVVCMKQVCDPATVKISRSREEFDLRGAVKITNPADRYALEAALRLREVLGGEVIALTVGDADAEDVAREAIAMGADRALLIAGPELATATGRVVTKALAAGIGHLGAVDLVLTGQAGAMDGTGAQAARLAAELSWPVVLDAVALAAAADGKLEATVAIGSGLGEVITLAWPAVVAVSAASERPRYPQPPRIANAWAPGLLEVCSVQDLGLTADALAPDAEMGNLVLPPERTRGQVIGGSLDAAVGELLAILRAKRLIADKT